MICTFGFTGNNSFKTFEIPLYSSFYQCSVKKDLYFSLYENKALNKVERNIFIKKMEARLPKYIGFFKKHTRNSIFSWQLIAALSYQESHSKVWGFLFIIFFNFIY